MKNRLLLVALLLVCALPHGHAAIISFETGVPGGFSSTASALDVTSDYSKLGDSSLQWSWTAGSVLTASAPDNLTAASAVKTGGIYLWIFSDTAHTDSLKVAFKNASGTEVCHIYFRANFTGWRVLQARFSDMGYAAKGNLTTMEIHAPATGSGIFRFDFLEFQTNVSWERSKDMQFHLDEQSAMIDDFVGCYLRTFPTRTATAAQKQALTTIRTRVEEWLVWGHAETDAAYTGRKAAITNRISTATRKTYPNLGLTTRADGSIHGVGLFPQQQTTASDGTALKTFRTVSENVLLPFAYDVALNDNTESLQKVLNIYDWYAEQGWAAGSGLGFLIFEKLRSAGYFHSLFLLRNRLDATRYARELETLRWYSLAGYTLQNFDYTGDNTDNLRSLMMGKLYYALLQTDDNKAAAALEQFVRYADNAFSMANGFSDMLKPDGSGYHHRGVYFGAYYPDGLYVASLVYYLLHDTPFALSAQTGENITKSLTMFADVASLYDVPMAACGRFPTGTSVVDQMLPAMAYMVLANDDTDDLAAYLAKRWDMSAAAVYQYATSHSTDICHKQTLGEIGLTLRAVNGVAPMVEEPVAVHFLPYSGMLIHRTANSHLSVKGMSKYVWDFEASSSENLYGRYLSYGQIELTDLHTGQHNNAYNYDNFNWNLIPGATTKRLSDNALSHIGGGNSRHRNFSDETFLGGIVHKEASVFAMRLHDNTFDTSFRATKSVFAFGDTVLCLGSGITSASSVPVQTTLFQQAFSDTDTFYLNGTEQTTFPVEAENGTLFCNQHRGYVVLDGNIRVVQTTGLMQAYLQHGNGANNATYGYYILPQADRNTLSAFSQPFTIVRQDDVAHIVRRNADGLCLMAVFDETQIINAGKIIKTDTPLVLGSSVTEDGLLLTIADPDMRRSSGTSLDDLSTATVYEASQPHEAEILLNGLYKIESGDASISYSGSNTLLKISLQDGMQKQVKLQQSDATSQSDSLDSYSYLFDARQRVFYFYTSEARSYNVLLFDVSGKTLAAKVMTNGDTLTVPKEVQGVCLLSINGKVEKLAV